MVPTECPNQPMLRAFVVGNLSDSDFLRVTRHVTRCTNCQSSLQSLDGHSDSFVARLRELPSDDGSTEVPLPRHLLLAARSANESSGLQSSQELIIDPGKRIATLLADGPFRLGRFDLLEQLGVGSFGYVFRAHDTELDRSVAVKIERTNRLDRDEDKGRFLREGRSAAQLKHPNIVSLYETGQTDDGVCYLVTELVEGTTLEDRLKNKPFSIQQTAALIADLADALHYAHTCGVIHRDIKPSNILLDREGRPHILDFGLAKREMGEMTVTADGEVMGTPAYMSPEQARGDSHHVDARSDSYSLGVILYELLTGDRPFQGNRRMLLLQLLEEEPRSPRRLNDKIPRDLEIICLKAMAKAPARRYGTARQLAEDLRRFLRREPIHARPISGLSRLWRWSRRNPMAASLFIAVSLGSTFGLLYLSSLSEHFVRETARESARMQADMLEDVNTFYSEIVEQVGTHVDVTHEYRERPGAMPLPATFTIEAGSRMSCNKDGMRVRLFSDHPFPWRTDGGPRDDFESAALAKLRQNPGEAYYEFAEIDGQPYLRFARARLMKESCLQCHNGRADSPKRDWKVGDVRGVLEIMRPLEKDIARTRSGLRGTFILVGVISSTLLGLAVLTLIIGNLRRNRRFSVAARGDA